MHMGVWRSIACYGAAAKAHPAAHVNRRDAGLLYCLVRERTGGAQEPTPRFC